MTRPTKAYNRRTSGAVYICGPMRGYAEFNFPAFDRAADQLRAAGWIPLSPAEHDRRDGFNPDGLTAEQCATYGDFDETAALRRDLGWLTRDADRVVLLPGWHKSANAMFEAVCAIKVGLPLHDWDGDGFDPDRFTDDFDFGDRNPTR